ncbi:MAG: DUF4010 domain-containing protein [Methylotetracoccus sp.]
MALDEFAPIVLPDLLKSFVVTVGIGFLIGLGLREYYLGKRRDQVFGSTRTCVFLSILGFALFELDPAGRLYLAGLVVVGFLLSIYYASQIARDHFGMIGILLGLLCYLIGPINKAFPSWFLILFAITILLVLNSQSRIRWLTDRLRNDEILTLVKFLVLAGVVLPLTSREPLADALPVSAHQCWLAVVVISGISYFGYLLQTYVFRDKGLLVSGAVGGLYSSTATTVAIARDSHDYDDDSVVPAAAILLASAMMYLRLLALVAVFNLRILLNLWPAFLSLTAVTAIACFALLRFRPSSADGRHRLAQPQNPLELTSALIFAALFLFVTGITHWVLGRYTHAGLPILSFVVGFTDIDPFVLSIVHGSFAAPAEALSRAIIMATASNNLLKAVYALIWGAGRTRTLAAGGLFALGIASLMILAALAI